MILARNYQDGKGVPQWQLKIEGRLLDEVCVRCGLRACTYALFDCLQSGTKVDDKSKLRFSNFFKSLVVELDREVYGPDSHLAEWHRSNDQEEMDGFTVSPAMYVCFIKFCHNGLYLLV